MKTALLFASAFAFFLSVQAIAAPGCVGQTTYCFDGCSGGNVLQANADACTSAFDPQHQCTAGYGFCSQDDVAPTAASCQGKTITCFDGCSGGDILQYNANTCSSTFDPQRGCIAASGFCQ